MGDDDLESSADGKTGGAWPTGNSTRIHWWDSRGRILYFKTTVDACAHGHGSTEADIEVESGVGLRRSGEMSLRAQIPDPSTPAGAPLWNCVLVLAALAVYLRSAGYGFIWDDLPFIVHNPAVQSWGAIPSWFLGPEAYAGAGTGAAGGMFRPMRNLSFLVDYSLFGLWPTGWHLHNVALHSLNAVLVAALLRAVMRASGNPSGEGSPHKNDLDNAATINWTPGGWAVALASLWWTLHPLHTEAVAWVKGRDDLLGTALFMAAILAGLAHARSASFGPGKLAAIFSLAFCAYLTKESTVVLGPVLATAGIFLLQASQARRRIFFLATTITAAALVFLVWRHFLLGQTAQSGRISGSAFHDALTMQVAFVRYAGLTLLPWHQVADYQGYPIVRTWANGWVWLGAFLVAGGVVIFVRGLIRAWHRPTGPAGLVALGCGWILWTMLPVSNIVPMMQFLAERFLYLPTVGVAVMLAGLLQWSQARVGHVGLCSRIHQGFLGYLLVLSLLCIMRLSVWQGPVELFGSIHGDGWPTGRTAQNYASALFEQGRVEEAHQILLKTQSSRGTFLGPADESMLHQGLATTSLALGRNEEAFRHIAEALKLNSKNVDALQTAGYVLYSTGRPGLSVKYYQEALRLSPGNETIRERLRQAQQKADELGQTY